jgi:chromate transport protein ChrA
VKLASFRSITLAWILVQSAAFALSVAIQPQGHFSSMTIGLFILGLGMAAIAGLGVGVVSFVLLQTVSRLNRGFQRTEFLTPWQLAVMAMVTIIGGTFILGFANQVFQDGNVLLFILMGILAMIAFSRSVTQG